MPIANIIHFLAGFVFAFVDTDQFLPELNPFTLDAILGADFVFRFYSLGFFGYFCWPVYRNFRFRFRRWWQPMAVGLGVFGFYGAARLLIDGHLFSPIYSLEIRNVMMIGLIAAAITNPASWEEWLKPFTYGSGAAFAIRAICHFTGQRQETAAMIGADSLGFYGTFGIHCVLIVTIGVLASIWFGENKKWRWMAGSICITVIFLAIVVTGFRRGSILQAVFLPIVGVGIAFWLRRQTVKGLYIAVAITLISAVCVGIVAVASFDSSVAWDRLLSVLNPTAQSSGMESNLSYMDDWESLVEVIQKHPLGVGYGNSYGVSRYIDEVTQGTDLTEFEPPLHVGSLDMVARTGPFGAWALIALVWTTLRTLLWMRGKVSQEDAMIAGALAGFFLVLLLMPLAPLMAQIKIMATYGIALGVVLQLAVRAQHDRHMRRSVNRSFTAPHEPRNFVSVPSSIS
jgi:hypothetical protein